MPSADGFTCVAVPGGPIGAFKLTADSRMLDCLSTIKDQTMDRHCHFFSSIGECQRASASSFKVNDVDDDYSNPNKYWTKARAMLMNQPPATSAPTTSSPPPPPLHQDKNLYAAAHVVNNTYECLSVGEGGCHYSQTNAECALWLQSENKCWVTGNC
ncbi:hypothetical protein DYB31_013996, partial [Aphanomyces astaci]